MNWKQSLLIGMVLSSCTNNVDVISYEVQSNKPKIRQISTNKGIFELREYEKGSEVTPLGDFTSLKPLRDLDGDWKPDETKENGRWVAIENSYQKESEKIYKSIHSRLN